VATEELQTKQSILVYAVIHTQHYQLTPVSRKVGLPSLHRRQFFCWLWYDRSAISLVILWPFSLFTQSVHSQFIVQSWVELFTVIAS